MVKQNVKTPFLSNGPRKLSYQALLVHQINPYKINSYLNYKDIMREV